MAKPTELEEKTHLDLSERIAERNALLKDIDQDTIKKAWFTLSHLLLKDGAKVVDMGCDNGAMTYTMAVLNPQLKFIGVEKNKRDIIKAREKYQLHNLEFKIGDATKELFEPESLDAIINSYVLHEVFSGSRYTEAIIEETLKTHFKMLKKEGVMFIRDYAHPPPEEFVLLELPDIQSESDDVKKLSDADLLIWYSEHAQPKQDPGCGGFFLEELPSRFPKTRLFHLPYKWAYEFIMRKDERDLWEKHLSTEYSYFTPLQFRRQLRKLGSRVQYSGLHWDEDYISKNFAGKFKLFDLDGTPQGDPATSYIAIAYKMAERKSLHIEERRPAKAPEDGPIHINAMRDVNTGQIHDIISRDVVPSEVLPYRVNSEGRLKLYLHDGITRSVSNAVARNGINFDRRRWSAHMVEPVSVDQHAIATIEEFDVKHSVLFARDYLGLKPSTNAIIEKGPDFYPSPDFIDERIYTYYLEVEKARKAITPKAHGAYNHKYQAKGEIREFDAQQVLNAIAVGMIPNSRLELQILMLFEKLNIQAENWTTKEVKFRVGKIKQKTNVKALMQEYEEDQISFKDVKGTAGQVRPVHSIFVEEGQTRGAMTGLTFQEVDFVVREDQTLNTAVVLPLSKGIKGDIHAGFQFKHLPVPQRQEGNSSTIAAPSFNLPAEITNLKMAKKYVADQFGVAPSNVIKLGESYYSHVGLTPQRIHPFAIMVPPDFDKDPTIRFLPYYQMKLLRRSLSKDTHMMVILARAYQYLHEDIKMDFELRVKNIVQSRFDRIQQDWALPTNFEASPIIGKRSIDEPYQEKPKVPLNQPVLEKVEDATPKENTSYTSEELTEEQIQEIEREVDEFIDVMEKHIEEEPRPEKW